VAEYPKLKQNFTAARDSSISGSTVMDVVFERCATLKCTLNALYTSHDVRINVKIFAEFRQKTRVKVVPGDTYIALKVGVLLGNIWW